MAEGITLALTDTQMREALSAALLASLDDGAREKVIAEAITYLTTERPKDGYSREKLPSPIQVAFNDALSRFAREWTEELIANTPGIKEQFEAAFKDVAAMLLENSEDLRNKVVESLMGHSIKIVSY